MDRSRDRHVPASGNSAFTLLEVLLSSVILAGMVVLLLVMTDGASRIWGDWERRRGPMREATAALNMMTDDLRCAVITEDPASLLIRDAVVPPHRGDALFFLVSHARECRQPAVIGDLCAAGYFIAPGDQGQPDLFRFHASGDEVMRALRSNSLPQLYATAAPGRSNTELLARNVADLRILRLPEGDRHANPGTLLLTITTLNGTEARRLASQSPDREQLESMLRAKGVRLSASVAMPPLREALIKSHEGR
jgi:hypothetical protein